MIASREVDRQFLFSGLVAGEYLLEAAFAERVLYCKVRVQAGHTVDLGLLEPAHASTLRVRVLKADGSPFANRTVHVSPMPRYTFPIRAAVTDGNGVCVVSREADGPIQLSYEGGYILVHAGSAGEVSIQLPDLRPISELRLTKDREPPAQVFWVSASPTAAGFYLLQPLGGSRFSLPRCAGMQTLVLTGDERGRLVVTAQRDESGLFVESAPESVPVKTQGAWSYDLQYTEIAGVACAPLLLGRRGRCMGSDTSHFLLASGVRARVRFKDQSGKIVFERRIP
jgi:hypothetical protein